MFTKVIYEPIRRKNLQILETEFELQEKYCHRQQEKKGQIILTLIKGLIRKVIDD